MSGGYIAAASLGLIYWVGCYLFLGIANPAWWELCVLGGLGAFSTPRVWIGVRGLWQSARELPKHPDDVVNNKWLFVFEIARVFFSRGLLAGTALWVASKIVN